eukprot:scaffold64012_cov23-Tisochrysis_lutea.AAC.1
MPIKAQKVKHLLPKCTVSSTHKAPIKANARQGKALDYAQLDVIQAAIKGQSMDCKLPPPPAHACKCEEALSPQRCKCDYYYSY